MSGPEADLLALLFRVEMSKNKVHDTQFEWGTHWPKSKDVAVSKDAPIVGFSCGDGSIWWI